MKHSFNFSFLLVFALFVSIKTYSYDFEVNGIYYGYDATNQNAYVTRGDLNYKGDITIPASVTFNGRTMDVTAIGTSAFNGCGELKSINLPSTITTIYNHAFLKCINLQTIELPKSLKKIDVSAFSECTSLKSIIIPNGVTKIEDNAFEGCTGLETVIFEDGEADLELGEYNAPLGNKEYHYYTGKITPKYIYIGRYFGRHYDDGLARIDYLDLNILSTEIISIGANVVRIPLRADYGSQPNKLKAIYCLAENPPSILELTGAIYANTKLYVPLGSKSSYQLKDVWKEFFVIEEMKIEKMWKGQGAPNIDNNNEKCEKPTISYANGKLTFSSATPNAICQSTITDTDISSFSGNEVQLTVTYTIKVYATASGYENSDLVTATLCWIDADPKTEGIENGISQVSANAVLIQSHDGTLSIAGVADGTDITVYSVSGQMVGSAKSHGTTSAVTTTLSRGNVAIVRIGDKSVKVVMQ